LVTESQLFQEIAKRSTELPDNNLPFLILFRTHAYLRPWPPPHSQMYRVRGVKKEGKLLPIGRGKEGIKS
jgi:hypothetical protein